MHKVFRIVAIGIFASTSFVNYLAAETSNEENLVNKAVESMEACLHWGGEVGDQSEERNQQIIVGAKRDCAEAEIYAGQAYEKYPNNSILASQMIRYITDGYFSVNLAELESLCRTATIFYENNSKVSYPMRHWYFEYKCLKPITK